MGTTRSPPSSTTKATTKTTKTLPPTTTTTSPIQQTSSLVPTTSKGSIVSSLTLDLNPTYSASSEWSKGWSADKAATAGGYWCSRRDPTTPVYWWLSIGDVEEEIVKIALEEEEFPLATDALEPPRAQFEFFASDTKACTRNGRELISGTRDEINEKIFANGRRYHCYGLKITNLPTTKNWGKLATLKNFRFYVNDLSTLKTTLVSTASSKVTTTSSPDSTNSATTTSTPDSTNSATTKTSSPSTTTTRSPSSTATTTTITTTATSPAATTSPIQQTSSSVPTTSGGSTVGVVVN